MKKGLVVFAIAAVVFALVLAVISVGHYSWRQKLTITLMTPTGEVSASSVSAVSWRKQWIRWDGMGWSWDLTGEAVVVEVTPGRYLFALLQGAGTTEYMGTVAAASIAGREGRVLDQALFSEVHYRSNRARGVITVPDYQFPIMVTFDDITKPETVREVDPEDLAAVFGEGVRLQAVTLEITEEAVPEGRVEGVLGWMPDYSEAAIIPKVDPMDFNLRATLRQGDFIRKSN
jgi:hypothetical protein